MNNSPTLAPIPAHTLGRRPWLAMACGMAALCVFASPVIAQDAFPSKAITIVVPFPPGGSADTVARLVGKRLSELMAQPVVIDNRAGAGTVVGATHVAKAPADGYTLLLSSGSTFTANPAIRPKLSYDPLKSFDPIGIVARIPLIVLANNDVPVNTVKEFVAAIKAAPEKYSYASFGSGTTSHFTAEIVLQAVGAKLMHVPYRGSAPAMTELIGGRVPFSVDTVTAAIPQIKGGKVKAIGVTTAKRSSQLPDVPSFAEAGYPEVNADTWIMLVAPKGIPAPVHAKLEKALAGIVAEPDMQTALRAQGAEPAHANAQASVQQIEKELPLMRAIAVRANIQPD
jgi:tripartite-type tricarboxylate transporter receptor subunit TctC